MRFEKERAIALIAGTGAVVLKLSDVLIATLPTKDYRTIAGEGFLLLVAGWGLWCSYRALRWAGKVTGNPKKFAENELTAVAVLAVCILGLGFTTLLAGGAHLLSANPPKADAANPATPALRRLQNSN